jgi:hypothetical protein
MKKLQTIILLTILIVAASAVDSLAQRRAKRNASQTASARAYYGNSITPKKAKVKYDTKGKKKSRTKVISRKKSAKSNRTLEHGTLRKRAYRS